MLDPPQPAPGGGTGATGPVEEQRHHLAFEQVEQGVVTGVPPFRGADVWTFALLAALACPAGQFLASAMLPNASVRAPALRRLDSLLIVAPAWAGLVGLYLQRAA